MKKTGHGGVHYSFKRTIQRIIIIISIVLLWWVSTMNPLTCRLPTHPPTFLAAARRMGVWWEGKCLMKCLPCLHICAYLWHKQNTKLFIKHTQSLLSMLLFLSDREEESLSYTIAFWEKLGKILYSCIGQMLIKQNLLCVLIEYSS